MKRVRVMIPMIFTVVCLCAVLCGTQVQAKVNKGKWKSNISWTYDTKTKVLTVSGSGEVAMFQTGDRPGWRNYAGKAKKVVFRGNITKIGGYTFWSFDKMTSVELPDSLKEIGEWAFNDTRNLKKIRLPSGLTKIENGAFTDSGLEDVTLPAGLNRLEEEAFAGCKLREVIIPSRVKKIGKWAFSFNHSLKKVTVSEGVEVLGSSSFSGCESLTDVTLPNSLKKIECRSFSSCESLTDVTLPDSLKKIEWASFCGTALKRIIIPKNVEKIGNFAFEGWKEKDKLRKVVIRSKKIKHWGKDIFGDKQDMPRKDLVIEVPKSKEKQYSKALQEKNLPSYVKVIGKKELD